MDTPKQS